MASEILGSTDPNAYAMRYAKYGLEAAQSPIPADLAPARPSVIDRFKSFASGLLNERRERKNVLALHGLGIRQDVLEMIPEAGTTPHEQIAMHVMQTTEGEEMEVHVPVEGLDEQLIIKWDDTIAEDDRDIRGKTNLVINPSGDVHAVFVEQITDRKPGSGVTPQRIPHEVQPSDLIQIREVLRSATIRPNVHFTSDDGIDKSNPSNWARFRSKRPDYSFTGGEQAEPQTKKAGNTVQTR